MIPITKNIFVVDEDGNEYEATYPKRAKGLVKSGRARFVSENRICLACPPKNTKGDTNMTEKMKHTENENSNKNIPEIPATPESSDATSKYSLDYVLGQIELIAKQTEHIEQAIYELRQMKTEGPGDIGVQAKATALANVVECRETTNQQILRMYEKMYDDLKPNLSKSSEKTAILKTLTDAISNAIMDGTYSGDELTEILNSIGNLD